MSNPVSELFDISVEDVEYLNQDGHPLMATVYQPVGDGPFPLVLEVHGGAWCRGSRQDEDSLNRALAARGIVVAAIDFLMPPHGSYPVSLTNINAALRWFKLTAHRWNTQPSMIGVMGVSSGGHQAVLAAMRAHDSRYGSVPLAIAGQSDAQAAFVVACWPVIDPVGRYRYAKSAQVSGKSYPEALDRVIPDHEKYWLTEAAMEEGSAATALENGEALELPPILYLQGESDIVHPRAHMDRFVSAYQRVGGDITPILYADQVEGFIVKKPDAPASLKAVDDIVAFIQRAV